MQRILKDTAPTISTTFYVDGVATDPSPDSATVTITRADGTVLVNAATATPGAAGVFSYTLTTSHTSLLDSLTVAWTSALGTLTETVEVVGGFLFTIAEARRIKPLDNTTNYPTDRIVEMRTTVEQALEGHARGAGMAFVPRYARETSNGRGGTTLLPKWPYVRAVRSASVDDTAVTVTDIDIGSNALTYSSGWTVGTGNVVLGYEHGLDFPPEEVRQAALILARSWIVRGPIDDRALGQASPDGGFSFGLVTPGRGGSRFGIPEVDAVIDGYDMNVGVS